MTSPTVAEVPVGASATKKSWRSRDWRTFALCIASGALLALSLPPVGFWPLAFGGILLLDRLLADRPFWSRFRRGLLVDLALLAPTMSWLRNMTAPGYVIAVVLFSVITGFFLALCPPGPMRRLALPAVWVLAELFRASWPFGGVPLSMLAVGQVGGPLVTPARVGGIFLIAGLAVGVGVALSALVDRKQLIGIGTLALIAVVSVLSAVAPDGSGTGQELSVAFVQGGGPQGTRASDTDARDVFDRHMKASEQVPAGLDLTLWPEDVVDTDTNVTKSKEGDELAALARRLNTTLIAGVVEDEGEDQFHNASVAWNSSGVPIDRYEKVHRVPFGEWVPFRSFLKIFAGDSLPSRDAVIGRGPATLSTPKAKLAVVISWEVFFGHRARDGVRNGGKVLINPTNGSSFSGTLVQSQQLASSRLRAIETGRWVVQIAPTGYSAFITPHGKVLDRSDISEAAVAVHDVELREGLTLYTRWGDRPVLGLALLMLAAAWLIQLFAQK